jgi:putative flippase GtrA
MMRLLREALRYGVVSVLSLAVNFAVLVILVNYLAWGNLPAATVSFLAGACVAYALSVRYVFTQHRLRDRNAELVTFVAIGALGLAVNLGVIYLATRFFALPVLYANCIAAGFSFSCNFFARRQILFVPAAHER